MSPYRIKMERSKSARIALASLGVFEREGWTGLFCTTDAPMAIPAGSRIKKVKCEAGDTHPVGALGTVLGSISPNDLGIMYFIEWDDLPKHAVSTIAWKVDRA